MAIDDLPPFVVNFLNVCGIKWPYIDESQVWTAAGFIRNFAQALQRTHDEATHVVVNRIAGNAYQGASTARMAWGWAQLSSLHIGPILDACHVLADALDAWGALILEQKGQALADLAAMATAFFADQAAAVATEGVAEALLPVIIEGAQRVVKALEETLIQSVAGQVIEAALKPLIDLAAKAADGLDWSKADTAAGTADGVTLDMPQLMKEVDALTGLATQVRGHATTLKEGLGGLFAA